MSNRRPRVLVITHHLYNFTAQSHLTRKFIQTIVPLCSDITAVTSSGYYRAHGGRGASAEQESKEMIAGITNVFVNAENAFDRILRTGISSKIPVLAKICRRIRFILSLGSGLPIRSTWWAGRAIRRITHLCADPASRPDLVISLMLPAESHVVGRWCAYHFSVPWLTYYSDPWPEHAYPMPYKFEAHPTLRRKHDELLRMFLSDASLIMGPSARMLRYMSRLYPGLMPEEKLFVFPHIVEYRGVGFSEADRLAIGNKLQMLHSGALHTQRGLREILAGIRQFLDNVPRAVGRFQLTLIGSVSDPDFGSLVNKYGLDDCIALAGQKSYSDSLLMQQQSDVLLLAEAVLEEGIFFPSKLADYLGCEKPILAVSPPVGFAHDILDGSPLFAPAGDVGKIAAAFEHAFNKWESGSLLTVVVPKEKVHHLTRDPVVEGLRKQMERILEAKAHS